MGGGRQTERPVAFVVSKWWWRLCSPRLLLSWTTGKSWSLSRRSLGIEATVCTDIISNGRCGVSCPLMRIIRSPRRRESPCFKQRRQWPARQQRYYYIVDGIIAEHSRSSAAVDRRWRKKTSIHLLYDEPCLFPWKTTRIYCNQRHACLRISVKYGASRFSVILLKIWTYSLYCNMWCLEQHRS